MEEQRALGISNAEGVLVYLRIDVAVGDENILPAVVVEVEELQAEAEKRNADGAEVGGAGKVGERAVVVVVKKIVGVVGEIGLCDVGPAVIVVVGGIDAHAGLFAAIAAVGDPGLYADFGKSSL